MPPVLLFIYHHVNDYYSVAKQTPQKLNFKEDLWWVKHIQIWLDESKQINPGFPQTKNFYKKTQV